MRLTINLDEDIYPAERSHAVAITLRTHVQHERVHRQLPDSWLAELAHRNNAQLATLDEPLSALWPDSTLLIAV